MTQAEQIEKLIDAAFGVMHHDADESDDAAIYERETLRRKFAEILGTPDAYRFRFKAEPDWDYGSKILSRRDFARKEVGFEEQALYALAVSGNEGKSS